MRLQSTPKQMMLLGSTIALFFAGAYWYATTAAKLSEGHATASSSQEEQIPESCPNLLVQDGTELRLYNTRNKQEQPKTFKNLEEYGKYAASSKCPILFLQKHVNAQGQTAYRVGANPLNPLEGVPDSLMQEYKGEIMPIIDASRDNGFNQNMYPGFDPYGLQIGRITTADLKHASTETEGPVSDNPMDSNWGGVQYTQAQLDAGKYAGNEVTKPHYAGAAAEKARSLYFGGKELSLPPALQAQQTRPPKRDT